MLPVKVASKSLYETSAVSLFVRLPMPMVHGIAAPTSRSHSHLHAYLFCILSCGLSRKRETARSLARQHHLQVNTCSEVVNESAGFDSFCLLAG